jgi:signal transduction histidine kinase
MKCALEAMKQGGVLHVQVTLGDGQARLVVKDTGGGIPPAFLAMVFDPFFTTKEGGTGLGVSIVRKIVDLHAGEVRIESHPGTGTEVTVLLPEGRREDVAGGASLHTTGVSLRQ